MDERGLTFDQLANRSVFSFPMSVDIFENVAKLRAARRMWAKTARNEFGSKETKHGRSLIWIFTSGSTMAAKHPLANITRISLELLSGVLGGANTLCYCSYDEAIDLPTAASQLISQYTDRIIAHETGIPLVADPLGGSYYVEWLTNRMEEEANKVLDLLDEQGGPIKATASGWLSQQIEKMVVERNSELNTGERKWVGVNAFESEDETSVPVRYTYGEGLDKVNENLRAEVKRFKETRDIQKTKGTLLNLRSKAEKGENLIYPMIEAWKADATRSEILGTIREGIGHSYDPFNMIERPAFLNT
jgi:methylmalonyl-CoA mutase N-terminal domain/subunit